jgi:hypothetical protein
MAIDIILYFQMRVFIYVIDRCTVMIHDRITQIQYVPDVVLKSYDNEYTILRKLVQENDISFCINNFITSVNALLNKYNIRITFIPSLLGQYQTITIKL